MEHSTCILQSVWNGSPALSLSHYRGLNVVSVDVSLMLCIHTKTFVSLPSSLVAGIPLPVIEPQLPDCVQELAHWS